MNGTEESRGGAFYRPELDGLRFFAFLAVFLLHALDRSPATASAGPWTKAWLGVGHGGLTLFFVLSAYLITELLLREHEQHGRIQVGSFLVRRALRIWPLYFVFLALNVIFVGPWPQLPAKHVMAFAGFAGNWSSVVWGFPDSFIFPMWSVSVEEQIYILWPLALAWTGPRRFVRFALGLLAVATAWRLHLIANDTMYPANYCDTLTNLDAFALGALTAVWTRRRPVSLAPWGSALLALGSLTTLLVVTRYAPFTETSWWGHLFAYPITALAACGLLVAALATSEHGRRSWLGAAPLVWLGRRSYGLYVFHLVGIWLASELRGSLARGAWPSFPNHPTVFVLFAALLITIGLAAVSFRTLEEPFLKLKKRFTFVPSGAPVPEALADPFPAAAPPPRKLTRRDLTIAVAFLVSSTMLYAYRIKEPPHYIFDEVYYSFSAAELAKGNTDANLWNTRTTSKRPYVAYAWVHPPLSGLFMQAGVRAAGDTPLGWRISSVVFGGLGIGLLYLLGASLFGSRVGIVAAVLMHLDGMWFVQSRVGMIEVYVVCFILLGYLAFLAYLNRPLETNRRYLLATGVAAGLAGGTKWLGLMSLGLFGIVALVRELREARPWRAGDVAKRLEALGLALVVVPCAVYVACYAQFFLMGHTVRQWITLQREMLYYHTHLKSAHTWASEWWSWPLDLRPIWFFGERAANGTERHVLSMGNPVLWWAFVPAGIACLVAWRKQRMRSTALTLLLIGFFGQWLPWALSPRLAFQYYFLPSVPFGCIAIAYALSRLTWPRVIGATYVAMVLATFLFLYPHFAAVPLSRDASMRRFWLRSWDPYAGSDPKGR